MFFSDDQEDYIFRPQLHLDSKWLNPDLQESFQDPDVLFELYNSLLLDREVYFSAGNGLVNSAGVTSRLGDSGKYYCGLRVSNYWTRCCNKKYIVTTISFIHPVASHVIKIGLINFDFSHNKSDSVKLL